MAAYTLFGVECSYDAGKIRAHLACKRVPQVEGQASHTVYFEESLPRVGSAESGSGSMSREPACK